MILFACNAKVLGYILYFVVVVEIIIFATPIL